MKNLLIVLKKVDCLKHFDGDIITDFISETITKDVYNTEIVNVTEEDIKKIANFNFKYKQNLNQDNETFKKSLDQNNQDNLTAIFDGNYDQLEEIVYNIPARYSDNYLDWIKIISILKKI